MAGRKPLQPTKIRYEQTEENFSPERLDMVFDFIFDKTIDKMRGKKLSPLHQRPQLVICSHREESVCKKT